jgi:hypothetical protein
MTAVMPCSRRAVAAPGRMASQGLKSESRKVSRASGASRATRGTLKLFAGRAKSVARWK